MNAALLRAELTPRARQGGTPTEPLPVLPAFVSKLWDRVSTGAQAPAYRSFLGSWGNRPTASCLDLRFMSFKYWASVFMVVLGPTKLCEDLRGRVFLVIA